MLKTEVLQKEMRFYTFNILLSAGSLKKKNIYIFSALGKIEKKKKRKKKVVKVLLQSTNTLPMCTTISVKNNVPFGGW